MAGDLSWLGDRAKPGEVVLDGLLNAWVLHFHRDEFAADSLRAVYLTQRGGRERVFIELGEDVFRLASEAGGKLGTHQRGMHRRCLALQFRKFGERLLRQDAALEAQRLAQFHRRTA